MVRRNGLSSSLVIAFLGGTVVCAGCGSGSKDINAKDSQTRTALWAAENGRKTTVDELLSEGVNVNAADVNGGTLLHFAAKGGHDALVGYLIGKGASVNAQDTGGNTPLHMAAIKGHRKTVQVLIGGGANRTIRNGEGKTPADVADLRVRSVLAL